MFIRKRLPTQEKSIAKIREVDFVRVAYSGTGGCPTVNFLSGPESAYGFGDLFEKELKKIKFPVSKYTFLM